MSDRVGVASRDGIAAEAAHDAPPGTVRSAAPDAEVTDPLLWREAQVMLARHARPDRSGECSWCGREWPCPPRRLAERADAASRLPWREAWTARHDIAGMRTLPAYRPEPTRDPVDMPIATPAPAPAVVLADPSVVRGEDAPAATARHAGVADVSAVDGQVRLSDVDASSPGDPTVVGRPAGPVRGTARPVVTSPGPMAIPTGRGAGGPVRWSPGPVVSPTPARIGVQTGPVTVGRHASAVETVPSGQVVGSPSRSRITGVGPNAGPVGVPGSAGAGRHGGSAGAGRHGGSVGASRYDAAARPTVPAPVVTVSPVVPPISATSIVAEAALTGWPVRSKGNGGERRMST